MGSRSYSAARAPLRDTFVQLAHFYETRLALASARPGGTSPPCAAWSRPQSRSGRRVPSREGTPRSREVCRAPRRYRESRLYIPNRGGTFQAFSFPSSNRVEFWKEPPTPSFAPVLRCTLGSRTSQQLGRSCSRWLMELRRVAQAGATTASRA